MCRERNIKGRPLWVHQGLRYPSPVDSRQAATSRSPCVISCPGHRLDPVGLRYRAARCQAAMACLGQWSPHPAIFHVAFLGQLPLACGLGAFWAPDCGGLSFPSACQTSNEPLVFGVFDDWPQIRASCGPGRTSGDTEITPACIRQNSLQHQTQHHEISALSQCAN